MLLPVGRSIGLLIIINKFILNSMKKTIQISTIVLIVFLPMLIFSQPQPWDPGVGGGEGANPVGGAVPLANGLIFLLSIGLGYGIMEKIKSSMAND
jgi:hypothetical protein